MCRIISIVLLAFMVVIVYGQESTTTVLSTTETGSTTSTNATCPEQCTLPLETGGRGKAPFRRWYFNQVEGECKKFRFTGRNGNANKFSTKAECEAVCEIEACGAVKSNEESDESDENKQ